jgi:phosphatidylglycerophosphate synthase
LLYLAAVLLDGCDGYAARRGGRTSLLGAGLDTLFDALGLALAACLLVAWGKAPTLYLTAGAAYYLFKGALAWRRKRRLAVTAVRPWNGARLLAGFQMGFAAAALLPLFSPPVTRLASWVALAPFLGGFLRDWRIATGQRAEACQGAAQPERSMGRRALQWVPPLLRLGLVPAALLPQGMPVRGVDLLLLALAVAGVCGRLAALLLAVTWGLALSGRSDLRCGEQTMLAMALVLTLTGSGPLALWRPEDRWLARRPGETAEEQR